MIARNMHCCAVGKVHGAMSFLGLVVFFTSFGKRLCLQASAAHVPCNDF